LLIAYVFRTRVIVKQRRKDIGCSKRQLFSFYRKSIYTVLFKGLSIITWTQMSTSI